jgi:hypothetical protein
MGNKTYNTKWTVNLDAIQRMANDGFSYTEIGEVFGVKGYAIRNLLNRRGLYITRKDIADKAAAKIERLRKANHQLAEIANDAVGWLPPASVNGPREQYQNKIKELTDGQ